MRAPLIAALSLFLSQFVVAGQVPVPSPSPYGRLPAGTLVAQFIRPEVKLLTLKPVLSEPLQGLRVSAGLVTRAFPAWRSISNPTFWPGLAVGDVTGDRHADLVVTLMTDEGTGTCPATADCDRSRDRAAISGARMMQYGPKSTVLA